MKAAGSGEARSRQEARLGLQPFTDDAGALLSVVPPGVWENSDWRQSSEAVAEMLNVGR